MKVNEPQDAPHLGHAIKHLKEGLPIFKNKACHHVVVKKPQKPAQKKTR